MKAIVMKAFILIVGFLQSLVLVFYIRQKTKKVQLQAFVSIILPFIIAYIYTFIRASLAAQLVNQGFPGSSVGKLGLPWQLLQCRRPQFDSWVGKIPWKRDRVPTTVLLGFPAGSECKESACNAGDLDSVPGLGRSSGGGHGNPLQYSCLENPHGQRRLEGYSPWDNTESDMTE